MLVWMKDVRTVCMQWDLYIRWLFIYTHKQTHRILHCETCKLLISISISIVENNYFCFHESKCSETRVEGRPCITRAYYRRYTYIIFWIRWEGRMCVWLRSYAVTFIRKCIRFKKHHLISWERPQRHQCHSERNREINGGANERKWKRKQKVKRDCTMKIIRDNYRIIPCNVDVKQIDKIHQRNSRARQRALRYLCVCVFQKGGKRFSF